MSDPMMPSASLLIKLGSALVHYQEHIETKEAVDLDTANLMMADAEVTEWIGEMTAMALLPVKR